MSGEEIFSKFRLSERRKIIMKTRRGLKAKNEAPLRFVTAPEEGRSCLQ
jgi:hypothetical protein